MQDLCFIVKASYLSWKYIDTRYETNLVVRVIVQWVEH